VKESGGSRGDLSAELIVCVVCVCVVYNVCMCLRVCVRACVRACGLKGVGIRREEGF
jgi:hypothetical protein